MLRLAWAAMRRCARVTVHPSEVALTSVRPCHPSASRVLLSLLLLFLLSFLAPSPCLSQTSSSVRADYVYTNHTGVPVLDSSYTLTITQFRSNESPNIQLSLPFAFNYWGSLSSTVYLSPNGAVQLDNSLECCTSCNSAPGTCCYFVNYALATLTPYGVVYSCSFSVNYYNLIAVSLTDLAPATSNSLVYGYSNRAVSFVGNTSVWNASYPFIIQYHQVPLAMPIGGLTGNPGLMSPVGVNFTFGVGLYPTGRIDLYYWNISDPALFDGWQFTRLWMVGLRQPAGQSQSNAHASDYADPNALVLPSNGTYLPRSQVVSNVTWSFWPIGYSTCSSPSRAVTQGGTIVRIVLKDYANSTANFTWQCVYRTQPSGGDTVGVVAAMYDPVDNELRCTNPPAAIGLTLYIALTADGVLLPLQPMPLSYVNTTSPYAPALYSGPDSFLSLELFCQSCTPFRPATCWYDCAGVLHGPAVLDECGTCVGGSTGLAWNGALDCLGVCYGPFVNVSGRCVCPSSQSCDSLPRYTNYVGSANTQYLASINSTLLAGSVPDPIIGYYDVRYTGVYGFTPVSAPLQEPLAFSFPFYTGSYNYVYVSPMGGFFFTFPSPTCLAHAAIALYDGTNACQYNLIAGYLAEFDISPSAASSYSFISTTTVFSVRFDKMHLASASIGAPLVSFSISIYPSGRILIQHQSVVAPSTIASIGGLAYTRQVLVGVMTTPRSASDLQLVYPSPFLPSQQVNGIFGLAAENEWRPTAVSTGTFPNRALIGKNGTVDFIPFGANTCIAPSYGSAAGGQLLHLNPSLAQSPYLAYVNLSCIVSGQLSPAVYNPTLHSLDCTMPPSSILATASVGLSDDQGNLVTLNRVYYQYVDPTEWEVTPSIYAQEYTTSALCNACYSAALSINTVYCYLDCNYDWRGSAFRDGCGSCVGGLTGNAVDVAKDCYGTCFGRYTLELLANYTQCACTIIPGLTSTQSGCAIVPTMHPTPSVYAQYIDSFTPLTSPLNHTAGNVSLQSLASSTNLLPLNLPFTFPFFAAPLRQVFVDADGAVYLTSTTPACAAQGSLSLWQGNSSCLHMLIAGALTALTPNSSSSSLPSFTSTISYSLSPTRLEVYYGQGPNSLVVSLSSDGSISLTLNAVSDPGGQWLVGVRLGVAAASPLMPFPAVVTASSYGQTCGAFACLYTGLPTSFISPTELQYLPNATYTSGYYPDRSRFAQPVTGTLTFCPLSIYFCLSPKQGPARGGTWVSFLNNVTLCSSADCCALRMNVSCNFGLVRVPARFDVGLDAFRCQVPAGMVGSVVNVWLEESGRQVGMAAPLFWTYNDTALMPVSGADVEQLLCHDCGAYLAGYCTKDCTGTWRGNATLDQCGVCVPPTNTTAISTAQWVATSATTPYSPVTDCLGVCYGPFTSLNASIHLPGGLQVPQCGCSVVAEPNALRSVATFPYTVLCAVWQRVDGAVELRDTLDGLKWYQVAVFVMVAMALLVGVGMEGLKWGRYVRRRMRMTPAERDRERRRRERRRQRERDRRERRRRLALGLPLPNQDVLPPGVAAVPVSPEPPAAMGVAGEGLRQRVVAGVGGELQAGLMQGDGAGAAIVPTVAPVVPTVAPPATGFGARMGAVVRRNSGGGGGGGGVVLSASEAAALTHLHGMGFNDDAVLVPLVRRCRGDVNAVINQLLR